MRTLLLDMCGRYNLGREMKPFAKVVKAFRGESVVVVLPRELRLEERPGGQGLTRFDDLIHTLASAQICGLAVPRNFEERSGECRRT
jgi:hypothetical protein